MSHAEQHPLSGKTVKIDTLHIPNMSAAFPARDITDGMYWVEDWADRLFTNGWDQHAREGNPACLQYAMRRAQEGFPMDDEVVYGKVGSFGYLLHVSELGEVLKEGR